MMSSLDKLLENKIAQNIGIWLILMCLLAIAITAENKLLTAFYVVLLLMPPVYINSYFILPHFRSRRRKFMAAFMINAIVFSALITSIISMNLGSFRWEGAMSIFGFLILSLSFSSALVIARDSFMRRQESREAELKLLKAQLNPHFLFNTLNNLYGLSVIKSDKLPGLMLKLSDLLRYSLYDTKEQFVDLEKELLYLANYISLEQIRLENQTSIEFKTEVSNPQLKIAPMLLIVFVENAFKHLGQDSNGLSKVSVLIASNDDEGLHLHCTNTYDQQEINLKNMEQGRSGIGLENAKKRLELLYPQKHSFKSSRNDGLYSISLNLTLTAT